MGNCLICNKKLYDNSFCDRCRPVIDKVKELRKKDKEWFEALFDRNCDREYVEGYDCVDDNPIIHYSMSKMTFVNILQDLLK
jgi:hypothetical protein